MQASHSARCLFCFGISIHACIGGDIAPNLAAALCAQIERHRVPLLPNMVVQLLQYTPRLTCKYAQNLQQQWP